MSTLLLIFVHNALYTIHSSTFNLNLSVANRFQRNSMHHTRSINSCISKRPTKQMPFGHWKECIKCCWLIRSTLISYFLKNVKIRLFQKKMLKRCWKDVNNGICSFDYIVDGQRWQMFIWASKLAIDFSRINIDDNKKFKNGRCSFELAGPVHLTILVQAVCSLDLV